MTSRVIMINNNDQDDDDAILRTTVQSKVCYSHIKTKAE